MPVWHESIEIGDLWKQSLPFESMRDEVVARIKASNWYRERDAEGFDELGMTVEDLAAAEDVEEWDEFWDYLYDLADAARVWLDIWKVPA